MEHLYTNLVTSAKSLGFMVHSTNMKENAAPVTSRLSSSYCAISAIARVVIFETLKDVYYATDTAKFLKDHNMSGYEKHNGICKISLFVCGSKVKCHVTCNIKLFVCGGKVKYNGTCNNSLFVWGDKLKYNGTCMTKLFVCGGKVK